MAASGDMVIGGFLPLLLTLDAGAGGGAAVRSSVALSLGIGFGVGQLVSGLSFIYSPTTIIAAFVSSTLIGVGFGFMPARSAALLDPVVALASE